MRIAKLVLLLAAVGYSTNSLALLCPGNFNQINMGDTVESVIAACGKPAGQTSTENTEEGPQEWNFYVQVAAAYVPNLNTTSQATLKTTIAFDKGKVTNMSVNGVGVSNTAICGPTIQVGDTMDSVKSACGKPAFINRGTGSQAGTEDPNSKNTKTTTLTYTSAGNQISLIFENGVLTDRK
ncbi:MAG: DUF2845 domain-containing protein [Pseudomonadota bacterium]